MISTDIIRNKVNSRIHENSELFYSLYETVLGYKPDIVLLISRRSPRLFEIYNPRGYENIEIITDLSLPYCKKLISGKKIAIVDDFVNLGSTMDYLQKLLLELHPREVKCFALSATDKAIVKDVITIDNKDENLNSKELSSRIPDILSAINKPFDLAFPIIPCKIRGSFRDQLEIANIFRFVYKDKQINFINEYSSNKDLRITINLNDDSYGISKLRVYISNSLDSLNIVPISVPLRFSKSTLLSSSITKNWNEEAHARFELFIRSFALGLNELQNIPLHIQPSSPDIYSHNDAGILFGEELLFKINLLDQANKYPIKNIKDKSKTSPFFTYARSFKEYLLDIKRQLIRDAGAANIELAFLAIFDVLRNYVGAMDIDSYKFNWPYTPEEIKANPYFRLRIGPTFDDIAGIVNIATNNRYKISRIRRIISILLDKYIDHGFIVPTFAKYGKYTYRIFRKGEQKSHKDKPCERAAYSLGKYLLEVDPDATVSQSNFSKMLVILSYCSKVDTGLSIISEEHGSLSSFPPELVDTDNVELTKYMLRKGFIKKS